MDPETSFFLDMRLFGNSFIPECRQYSYNKVVDFDTVNFKDFVDDILSTYPSVYTEVVKFFYVCMNPSVNWS